MVFLSWSEFRDSYCQTTEFLLGKIEQVAQLLALFLEWLESPQTSVGSMSDSGYHLQIAQKFLERGNGCGFKFGIPLHLQKQLRLFEKTLSDLGWCLSPSDIQLPGLPAGELVPRECSGHLLAVLEAGTRHRHQILHRHLRGDLPRA